MTLAFDDAFFDDAFDTFFDDDVGVFAADGRLPVSPVPALVRFGAGFCAVADVADVADCFVEVFAVGEADFTSVFHRKVNKEANHKSMRFS